MTEVQVGQRILWIVQTATEHTVVCAFFLRELAERGVRAPHGLLVVLDGARGFGWPNR